MNVNAPSRSIMLARIAPFRLGAVEVLPSTSEVVWIGGREMLQPRVMQVLVALADQRGTVVSHDDLIATCWDGRIVGEDAVQRCVARIRQLAKTIGGFTIETIPRIGYRLDVTDEPEPSAARVPDPSRLRNHYRLRAALAVAGVVIASATGAFLLWPPASAPLRIEVTALEPIGSKDSRDLAQTLQGDIVDVLNQSGIQTSAGAGGASWMSRRTDLALRGSVARIGQRFKVHVLLEDVASGLTLWSDRFERDATAADSLADQVAVAATETIHTIVEINQQKDLKLDPQTVALFLRGSELVRTPQLPDQGVARGIFEQVVAHAPNFANGHGLLALTLENEARASPRALPGQASLRAHALQEAATAIRIDPYAAGAAWDMLYMMARREHPGQVFQAEDRLLEGLRNAPDYPFLNMRECRVLTEVGRGNDAVTYCRRALALRPLAGPIGHTFARALSVAGAVDDANAAIERAARYNPDQIATRVYRFQLAAFGDHPELAEALLRDPATRPPGLSTHVIAAMESFLLARRTRRTADVDEAARLIRALPSDNVSIVLGVSALAALARTDDAFAMLDRTGVPDDLLVFGAGFLFEPVTTSLRKDPRFWSTAAHLGLAQYWAARQKWPDICGREIALAVCQAETRRALAGT